MRKYVLTLSTQLFMFTLAFGQSWFGSGINGEGPVVEKTLNINNFDAVSLSMSANVYLMQGKDFEVKVSGQKNIIDNLKTQVVDREWKIGFEQNVRRYEKLEIHITMPDLRKVHISGSGNISSRNAFSGLENVSISISGSGDINMDLEAKSLDCRISGSGDINLRGMSETLELKISGSGDIQAEDLRTKSANIAVSGSGNCSVNAEDELDVRISGSGDVKYTGRPRVNTRISGSGSLRSN